MVVATCARPASTRHRDRGAATRRDLAGGLHKNAIVVGVGARSAASAGDRHIATPRRDRRTLPHMHADVEDSRARPAPAGPRHSDCAAAARRDLAATHHLDATVVAPCCAGIAGHRHIAAARRNRRTRADNDRTIVDTSRSRPAGAGDGQQAACPADDVATPLNSDTVLIATAVSPLALDRHGSRAGGLNQTVVHIDANKVPGRRRDLLVGVDRNPAIRGLQARVRCQGHVASRSEGNRSGP